MYPHLPYIEFRIGIFKVKKTNMHMAPQENFKVIGL